jgi:hypothetical protein
VLCGGGGVAADADPPRWSRPDGADLQVLLAGLRAGAGAEEVSSPRNTRARMIFVRIALFVAEAALAAPEVPRALCTLRLTIDTVNGIATLLPLRGQVSLCAHRGKRRE